MPDSLSKDVYAFSHTVLTSDLADSVPDVFKDILVAKTYQNPRVAPILRRLVVAGKFSKDSIFLQKSWVSETTGNTPGITFGFHEIPRTVQDQVFYTASPHCPKGYEQQALYRFAHEVFHKYISTLVFEVEPPEPHVMELLEYATQPRYEGGIGLSAYGTIVYEGNPLKQANEDVTELLNMYAWDPQYFGDYLDFLANPQTESIRTHHKLVGLTSESRDHIFHLVESLVASS